MVDVRSFKVIDIAVFDVVATLAMVAILHYIIQRYLPAQPKSSRSKVSLFVLLTVWTFATAFIVHLLVKAPTKLGYYFKLNKDPRPAGQ